MHSHYNYCSILIAPLIVAIISFTNAGPLSKTNSSFDDKTKYEGANQISTLPLVSSENNLAKIPVARERFDPSSTKGDKTIGHLSPNTPKKLPFDQSKDSSEMHNAAGRNQIKTATPAEANINDSAKPKEAEDEGADESSTEEDLADVENNLVDEKIGSSSQDVHVHPVTTSQAIETISSTPVPNLNPQKPLVDNDPSAEDPNTVHHGKDLYEGTEAPNVISSTEAPISSPSPSTNVKEEEEVQGLSSINNVTTLDNSPENFHANEASEKTTEASSMSIKQSESTTAKPSIQQSINALTTPILTTTTPADEEVLEDEQSIWQRIIHGIRCAKQDCKGTLRDEFLAQLDEDSRRLITDRSWTIKMRRARFATGDAYLSDGDVVKPPLIICTCKD